MANGVYAEKEQKYVEKFQDFKGMFFKPLLYILTALNINANQISILSFCISFISMGYAIYSYNPVYFLVGVWVHIFLDSIDGALARYQNKASKIGSFIDVLCDHAGILASGFYMLSFTSVNPLSILLFITLYTVDIYNLFIANVCHKPIAIVFRPRLFVYLALVNDYIFQLNYTNNLLTFLNLILLIQTMLSFIKIKEVVLGIDN